MSVVVVEGVGVRVCLWGCEEEEEEEEQLSDRLGLWSRGRSIGKKLMENKSKKAIVILLNMNAMIPAFMTAIIRQEKAYVK